MADTAEETEDGPDAQVIVLRADDGTTEVVADTPENRQSQANTAAHRRAKFLFDKDGAMARAGQLPRLMTGTLSAGATNLMLVKLLQGELAPQTAKEAAEVAKITHQIFQQASGSSPGNLNLTPAERAERLTQIDRLQVDLEHRAKEATELLGGAPADGEEIPEPDPVEPDEWEHDDAPSDGPA